MKDDLKNLSELNIQPVTFFEVKGLFFVTLFPSIFQGFTAVLCGKEKGSEQVRVIHDCMICKAYGHENCPYVKEGINYYKQRVKKDYPSYSILQRKVTPNPKWYQLTKNEMAEFLKKVKESANEPVTQHITSS
ncbi:hypothetical protein [Gracilibacillus thailandensis]|uniref:Uncharacterized protein n=1 Tax=Gracilibacillus thailandensis TaxID=563735 RepID=A0A6N7QVZ0_9BACI|nr:hypothetical protein [Gracilibacillus thailandensis]MRI66178.1 hypothetical protein [Gracilibacillus thailandensis]